MPLQLLLGRGAYVWSEQVNQTRLLACNQRGGGAACIDIYLLGGTVPYCSCCELPIPAGRGLSGKVEFIYGRVPCCRLTL